ncbi:hypothetical protein QOT17_005399 [Balamuthia mandrillaris]
MEGEVPMTLESLRAKAESIKNVIASVDFERNSDWKELLGLFSVLATHFHILNAQFNTGHGSARILSHFVVQPKKLTPEPTQLPEMLRTKGLPELEAREAQLVSEYNAQTQPTTLEQKRVTLETMIREFNAMCDSIESSYNTKLEEVRLRPKKEIITTEDTSKQLDNLLHAIVVGRGLTESSKSATRTTTQQTGKGTKRGAAAISKGTSASSTSNRPTTGGGGAAPQRPLKKQALGAGPSSTPSSSSSSSSSSTQSLPKSPSATTSSSSSSSSSAAVSSSMPQQQQQQDIRNIKFGVGTTASTTPTTQFWQGGAAPSNQQYQQQPLATRIPTNTPTTRPPMQTNSNQFQSMPK